MSASKMAEVVTYLRRLLRHADTSTDAQLLERFVAGREEAALESLIERHGPMVWGVCRRLLANHHDAEDAFQATFLVLCRKAASIWPRHMLGNWLHGVAMKVARKGRSLAARRLQRERPMPQLPETAVAADDTTAVRTLIDEEVNRLPAKFRAVIVLCELEGCTRSEAAEQLAVPEGTVASRLARARSMLARRFARDGVSLPATAAVGVLGETARSATVLASLTASTLKAGLAFTAGQSLSLCGVSAGTMSLFQGVMTMAAMKKVLLAAVILFTAAALGTGVGYYASSSDNASSAASSPNTGGPGPVKTRIHGEKKPAKESERVAGAKEAEKAQDSPRGEDGKDDPKPLPPEIIEAWKKAGAKVVWMSGQFGDGYWDLDFPPDASKRDRQGPLLPAFVFRQWQDKLIAGLPEPAVPYGLYLSVTEVGDAGLKELAGLKHLQALQLGGTKVTDAGLKELARLKNLQGLSLAHTQVTDAGIKEMAGLKSLQWLDLSETPLTGVGLKELARLKRLQRLNFRFSKVTDAGLKELSGFKSLQILDLDSTKVTDTGLKDLAGLASLKDLRLAHTNVTDAGLKELSGLENLHRLSLYGTKVTDAGLKELAGFKKLELLYLGSMKVTDAGLKELTGFKSLQSLSLFETRVTDAGLKELSGLKNLEWLTLSSTNVTDAGLKELARLKSLKSLYLMDTHVTDAGLKELPGLNRLESLDISFTNVTDAGLKELAGMKSLRRVVVGNRPPDPQLKKLADLAGLQWLLADDTKLTAAGVAALKKAMPDCKISSLTTLK